MALFANCLRTEQFLTIPSKWPQTWPPMQPKRCSLRKRPSVEVWSILILPRTFVNIIIFVIADATFCLVSPSTADSLGRDDEFERTLYYITFGTEEKKKGVNGFLKKP